MEKKDIYNSIILVNSNDVSKVKIASWYLRGSGYFSKGFARNNLFYHSVAFSPG